jgi:hypothetical protein
MKRNVFNQCFLFTMCATVSVIIFIAGCGADTDAPHKTLNGSWKNDIMVVKFDFKERVYSGVALGQDFSKKLTLVSEEPGFVVFRSDEDKIICQFQDDGGILLTKDGGIPMLLHKIK